jgi:hypothetical protein
MTTSYEFERYICSKETLRETIETFGVAIIPNVLDDIECESMVNKIWDFLEHITQSWEIPIVRNNTETWNEFYKLYPSHSMLLQYWGIGHAQASWDVRQNKKIVEVFAYFWGCGVNELLVSFDGLSFHLPPEITKRGWFRGNTNYHTDQSFTTPDFKCIQSFITGLDINEYDSTLSFMESSNQYHSEFRYTYEVTEKSNWYKLTKKQRGFYMERGCEIKNIKCPKGSLVFWDSRTIHCGIEADKRRVSQNIRAVIYLCYMPRSICSKTNLKKKQRAFQELRATTHYPCNIKLFPKNPHTYGKPIPTFVPVEEPILNDLGKSLSGF